MSADFAMNSKSESQPESKGFTLRQICEILEGTIITGEERADQKVTAACGSDLMSDVLAFAKPASVLLTGLTNPQVVRTAEMLDIKGVVFVRDKTPEEKTIQMAQANGLVLILSPYPLYESCGRLFKAGLNGAHVSRKSPGRHLAKT